MDSKLFKIITDEQEAKKLWEDFSPHKTIDDEWNFRYAFGKDFNFPFHFIVGYEKEKPIGVLPLQLNTVKGLGPKLLGMNKPFLEFFGGVDTDDNHILLLPEYENHSIDFLRQINMSAILNDLKEKYTVDGNEAQHYTDRFEVDLENINDFESYLESNLQGKSKRNIKNEIKYFYRDYTIETKKGGSEELELLFRLSKERFGRKSSFHMDYRQQIYRDFIDLYDVDIFTIILNGAPKAVSYGIMFKNTYILLSIGYDYSIPNLAKFLFSHLFTRAKELGCTLFDAGKGDNGWKERFHLTKIPQYKLTIGINNSQLTVNS